MSRLALAVTLCLAGWLSAPTLSAQGWRDSVKNLIYAPRYFGPNAFPIPELRNAQVPSKLEWEVRGEYHYYTGDQTSDIFTRLFYPFAKGKAGLEVGFLLKEKYRLSQATKDERHAVATESPIGYSGDVVIASFFQLLGGKGVVSRAPDVMLGFTLKTASGGRLCDARFTDATAYWMYAVCGKNISAEGDNYLRLQAMLGFYCWTTNDLVHRQNDAPLFGAGLSGRFERLSFASDLSGFYGYENNGDRPLVLRNVLSYTYSIHSLSLRYHHGMKDNLYQTYALSYTLAF